MTTREILPSLSIDPDVYHENRFATNLSELARACVRLAAMNESATHSVSSTGVTTEHRQEGSDQQSFGVDFLGGKQRGSAVALFTKTLEVLGIESAVQDVDDKKHVRVTLPASGISTHNSMLRAAADEIGKYNGNFVQAAEAVSTINRSQGMFAELGVRQIIAEGCGTPPFMPVVRLTISPENAHTLHEMEAIQQKTPACNIEDVHSWRDAKMHSRDVGFRMDLTEMKDIEQIRQAVIKDERALPVGRIR